MKKYLTILLACAAVFACQNKEDLTPAQEEQKKFTGDEAYISIRLADVGSLNSKADFGGFEDANNTTYFKEGGVKSAHFYFYDAAGYFVSEAAAWPGGSTQDPADDNIEFKSNNTVVLKGLEQKNYPKFMVTVLNKPDNFKPGNTLAEMEKAMSGINLNAVTNGDGTAENDNCIWNSVQEGTEWNNYFVMSTSSYTGTDREALGTNGTVASGKVPYFATLLKQTDFKTEPVPADPNTITDAVTVYVERLAAKVTFKTSMTATEVTLSGTTDKKNMYPLAITLAGDDNDLSGTAGIENVYIDLESWGLNATARNSYMSKNLNTGWDNTDSGSLGFVWNDETHHRSYWGKSFNYDNASMKYHDADDNATTYNSADPSFPLHYQQFSGEFKPLDTPLYCAENTNTPAILKTNNGVTNVMLRARVYKETVAGNKIVAPMDMVRYNGVLYTNDRFINQLLTILNTNGDLTYYYCSKDLGSGNVEFTKLDKQFFELQADGAGVKVVIKDLTSWVWPVSTTTGIYKYDNSTSGYVPITDATELTSVYSALNTKLLAASQAGNATGFKGGQMFYTIRIKHANNGTPAAGEVLEANYGVVRNHVYAIDLKTIKKVGHAIFDENVTTSIGGVGGGDEPESYYVGANINVLSWKIVNQDVEL